MEQMIFRNFSELHHRAIINLLTIIRNEIECYVLSTQLCTDFCLVAMPINANVAGRSWINQFNEIRD